jgi:hypothetical protein
LNIWATIGFSRKSQPYGMCVCVGVRTEETREEPQSRISVSSSRFEPGNFRLQARNITACIWVSGYQCFGGKCRLHLQSTSGNLTNTPRRSVTLVRQNKTRTKRVTKCVCLLSCPVDSPGGSEDVPRLVGYVLARAGRSSSWCNVCRVLVAERAASRNWTYRRVNATLRSTARLNSFRTRGHLVTQIIIIVIIVIPLFVCLYFLQCLPVNFFIWFVRLLALRPLLAYCASLGW